MPQFDANAQTISSANDALLRQVRREIQCMAVLQERRMSLEPTNPFANCNMVMVRQGEDERAFDMRMAIGTRKPPMTVMEIAADRCNLILMEAVRYEQVYQTRKQSDGMEGPE